MDAIFSFVVWMYLEVVTSALCPIIRCMVVMSTPWSRRWVAKQWRLCRVENYAEKHGTIYQNPLISCSFLFDWLHFTRHNKRLNKRADVKHVDFEVKQNLLKKQKYHRICKNV